MEAQLYNATKNVPDYTDATFVSPKMLGVVGGDAQTAAITPNRGGTWSAS